VYKFAINLKPSSFHFRGIFHDGGNSLSLVSAMALCPCVLCPRYLSRLTFDPFCLIPF